MIRKGSLFRSQTLPPIRVTWPRHLGWARLNGRCVGRGSVDAYDDGVDGLFLTHRPQRCKEFREQSWFGQQGAFAGLHCNRMYEIKLIFKFVGNYLLAEVCYSIQSCKTRLACIITNVAVKCAKEFRKNVRNVNMEFCTKFHQYGFKWK